MLDQSGHYEPRVNDLNQQPHGPKPSGADFQVAADTEDTSTEDSRCTSGYTSLPETVVDEAVQLGELVARLTPAERARIAALLVGDSTGNGPSDAPSNDVADERLLDESG